MDGTTQRPTADDLNRAVWAKAAASAGNGGCLEVAFVKGHVAIRDNEDPDNPPFVVTEHVWRCFLDGAGKGEFTPPGA